MHMVPREALVRASRGTDLDDWYARHNLELSPPCLSCRNLDMFNIAFLTDKHPLLYKAFVLFTKYDLFTAFSIDKGKFAEFILYIESHYFDNTYHNRLHAADTQ